MTTRHPSPAPSGGSPPGQRFTPELMHAAATLYYLQDATQADVAKRLGTSRATVSRLLSEARRLGIVRIDVVPPQGIPEDLGPRTAEALQLQAVRVVPHAHDSMLGQALAPAVDSLLREVRLEAGDIVLVSSGRTVWEVAQALESHHLPDVIVTPTVGGQDEPEAWYQTNEVTRRLAEKLHGRPVFLYAPALPGPQLHERLVADPSTRRVLELWSCARVALLGVGAPPRRRSSMPGFVPRDADWLREAVGDICTRFYDSTGRAIDFPGSDRLVATTYEALRQIPVTVGLAVGTEKVPSLLAGARAGWFNTLVTDEPTAQALLAASGR